MTTIGSPFFASNSSGRSAWKSYCTIAYTLTPSANAPRERWRVDNVRLFWFSRLDRRRHLRCGRGPWITVLRQMSLRGRLRSTARRQSRPWSLSKGRGSHLASEGWDECPIGPEVCLPPLANSSKSSFGTNPLEPVNGSFTAHQRESSANVRRAGLTQRLKPPFSFSGDIPKVAFGITQLLRVGTPKRVERLDDLLRGCDFFRWSPQRIYPLRI
jgi:hypothetical protein